MSTFCCNERFLTEIFVLRLTMSSNSSFKSEYGYFTEDGREYVITRPDTPKSWVNVISNGDYGFVVSQAGGGYSWRSHASLNRITRWNQDLVRDADGRFLYLRDEENGDFWLVTSQPTQPDYEHFECRHRQGSTEFITRRAGIEARWTLSVAPDAPLEIWMVTLRNLGTKPRRISLFSYLEWLLGAAPDWHREFHKTFIETSFEREANVILATKCNWEPPIPENSHWNIDWPYVAFHSASRKIAGFETDKQAFLGQYGSPANPQALRRPSLQGITGRWGDAIASLQMTIDLAAGAEETAIFMLGAADDRTQALSLAQRFTHPQVAEAALAQTHASWQERTSRLQVESPDPALNLIQTTG